MAAPRGPFDQESTNRTLVIAVGGGRRFWVSRELLTMYSTVFNTMVFGNNNGNARNVIALPNKTAADFEEFLRCLMPSPEVKEIDLSNVELMLDFAREYQIADLKRRSIKALVAFENQWDGRDDRLLLVLRIAIKYRFKQLLPSIIKKCAVGFNMGQLQPMFNTLPTAVTSGLLRYKAEIPYPGSEMRNERDADRDVRDFVNRM